MDASVHRMWKRIIMSDVRVSAKKRGRSLESKVEMAWAAFTVLFVIALSYIYFSIERKPSADGRHTLVMNLGYLGTFFMLIIFAFSYRKRLSLQGFVKLRFWLKEHIYLSIITTFVIFYHATLKLGGPVTAWLLCLFSVTIVSGLFGWWITKKIPPLLTAVEEEPAIIEDLLESKENYYRAVVELSQGKSEQFRDVVARGLRREMDSWSLMIRFYRDTATVQSQLGDFQKKYAAIQDRLPESERQDFKRVVENTLRINKVNAELFLQRVLRRWLTLHIVISTAMAALAIVHIFSVFYY